MKKEKNTADNNKAVEENINTSVNGASNSKKAAKAAKKEAKKANKKEGGVAFLLLKIVIAVALVTVIAYFGFACVVREGNTAVILRFGEVRQSVTDAGIYFKLPWPFESVVTYDGREQYLEHDKIEVPTKDEDSVMKTIILQTYAVWKINDPVKYHNQVQGNGEASVPSAIRSSIWDATHIVMGNYNLSDMISSSNENLKIEEIQEKIFNNVKSSCEETYGIEISDVRILRISFPQGNLNAIVQYIQTERGTVIAEIDANAEQISQNIMSAANAEAAKIIAEGENKAAEIRAKTEKEVAEIYAKAQEANLELFQFLKELDTIVKSTNSNSVLVVDSNAYPFNVLLEYSEKAEAVDNLEELLEKLPDKEREDLIIAINDLLAKQKASGSEGT